MKKSNLFLVLALNVVFAFFSNAQEIGFNELTIDRIFNSREFSQDNLGPITWYKDGESYVKLESSEQNRGIREVIAYKSVSQDRTVLASVQDLTPQGSDQPLSISSFQFTADESRMMIFTNTKRVWRVNTRGDYWVLDLKSKSLKQLGKSLPASSLMFAKFSPDNKSVAYVSEFNVYKEDFKTGKITPLTKDGTRDIINGTFDWVYEEELFCKDGFRWSGDGNQLAIWQLDASDIKNFSMINNTDSIYSRMIPIQYPKVGEDPSSAKVGSIDLSTQKITWMNIPGDPKQNYLPRMQWVDNQLLVQQLNRKQNQLNIYICNPTSGDCKLSYSEKDDAWVDIMNLDLTANWSMYDMKIIGKSFLRVTEKDGWRHVYKVKLDGTGETNLTNFDGDVARFYSLDEKGKNLYINASPENPTQRYLYQIAADGKGKPRRITPEEYAGVNTYNISQNSKYAIHSYSNINTPSTTYLISLPSHKIITTLVENQRFKESVAALNLPKVEFFKVTTSEGIEMDGRLIMPNDFEADKKYPVIYFTYGGPAGTRADDSWSFRGMYHFMLAQKGYVIIIMDARGTPSLKGSEWRKALYKQVGILPTRDFALAAIETLKWDFIDSERTAFWGWSSGGKMALNLIFRYPEVFKTAIAVAPASSDLLYDNVYTERYMGLKSENLDNYNQASALSQAKNLEGNLLIIHGTGDDNVHYQNTEMLMNELIKHNKQFQVMPYPNRSHGIYEGENTRRHMYTLMMNYFLEMNPVGAK